MQDVTQYDLPDAEAIVRSKSPATLPSIEHLRWWRWAKDLSEDATPHSAGDLCTGASADLKSPVVQYLAKDARLSRMLWNAEFAHLRRAKLAAWYLCDEPDWKNRTHRGGYTREQHEDRFWDAIKDVDVDLKSCLKEKANGDSRWAKEFQQFVLVLYYLRSAEAFAWTVDQEARGLTLSDAVAASANFPPVFLPYSIFGLYDPGRIHDLALTDGGVHDNQGLDVLLEEQCSHIIASDAGGLLEEEKEAAGLRLSMMARVGHTLMGRVRDLQLTALREERRVTEGITCNATETGASDAMPELLKRYQLKGVAFFHMTSNPSDASVVGALDPHPHAKEIAALRTDLDAFHDIEIDGLVYQGYQLCDRFARCHLNLKEEAFRNNAASPWEAQPPSALASGAEADREQKLLRAGHARLFRLMRMYPTTAKLCGIALVAALLLLALFSQWSVNATGIWLGARLGQWLGWPLSRLLGNPLSQRRSLFWLGFLLVGLFVLWVCWAHVERWLARKLVHRCGRHPHVHQRITRVARRLRLWRRNIFWLFGLLPLVAAMVGTLAATLVWLSDRASWRLGRRS